MTSRTRVDEPAPSHTDLLPTVPPDGRSVTRARLARLIVGGLSVVGAILLAVVVAWIVDLQVHANRVVRNTEVGGIAVGGLDRAAVSAVVDRVARDEERATVHVHTSGKGFTVPAAALRFGVRRPVTV